MPNLGINAFQNNFYGSSLIKFLSLLVSFFECYSASLNKQLDALVVKFGSKFVDKTQFSRQLLDFDARWRHSFNVEDLIEEELKKNVEEKIGDIYSGALYRLSQENDKNLKNSRDDVQKIISVRIKAGSERRNESPIK